jgi:DNA-binding CsgD family transcriptional regulator
MILIVMAVLGVVGVPFALAVIRADDVNAWLWALPQRLRGRGWGLLLAPITVAYALLAGTQHLLAALEILAGGLVLVLAPRLAVKAVLYALLALGGYGLALANAYLHGDNTQVLYGLVLAGAYSSRTQLVLPEALLFLAAGLWLLFRVRAPGAGLLRALAARWRRGARAGIRPVQSWLLPPVTVLGIIQLAPGEWFGARWFTVWLVLDPEVVSKLMVKHSRAGPLTRLTPREREVLALMAEGRSNAAIAQRLFIAEKSVSKHAAGIFAKLGLAPSDDDNRRVLAVLTYLNS